MAHLTDDLIRHNTQNRITSAGMWIEKSLPDSPLPAHICGNVMVKCIGEKYRSGDYIFWDWRIFLNLGGEWIMVHPKSRPYGYGCSGSAKVGSRLMGNTYGKGPRKPRRKK